MMRYLYTFFLYLLTPVIVLRLYWKSRRLPAYRQRMGERFVLNPQQLTPVDIWIHAVSLGEVVAATPLIDALLTKQWRVMITTMTPTGSAQVTKRFGTQVQHQYIPYDLPWLLRRFFNQIKPRLGLIMETELWPNTIVEAKRMNMPLLLANARLSDRAFKQYQKVAFFFKPVLEQFTAILAQSEEDAQRFIALGAPSSLVHRAGNMKFDLQLQVTTKEECVQLKERWGKTRPVLIAASTHHDEESQLLSHLNQLKAAIPDVLIVFVPRHPERFQTVYELCKTQGFNTGLRSNPDSINEQVDIVVVDAMGELLHFYRLSDYAFVGGSLAPIGGHNVLEPIAVQVPVFCGPYMQNSKEICQELCNAGALQQVENADALIKAVIDLHKNAAKCEQQVENASTVLAINRGTVARCMEKIEALLI